MARQARIAAKGDGDPAFLAMKQSAARYFLDVIVPELSGSEADAIAASEFETFARRVRSL